MASVVTNAGLALPSAAMVASVTKYIGWGTGAGTAAAGDTTLSSEKALDLSSTSGTRNTGSQSAVTTTQTNDTYQVTSTLTATGAGTVTNVGLFDNATIGSGTLYVHADHTGVVLASGDAIAYTIKVKFS